MKKFVTPEVEIMKFSVADVITTSPEIENGDNMTDKG